MSSAVTHTIVPKERAEPLPGGVTRSDRCEIYIPGCGGVTPPLAGVEGSKRTAFLAYDFCGSLLWSGLYTSLGYLFANRIAAIAASMAGFGDILAALDVGRPYPRFNE